MTTPFSAHEHETPEARLELAFIEEFFQRHGLSSEAIRSRTDPAGLELWRDALQHAAMKLAEIEARAHYVHDIHGVEK